MKKFPLYLLCLLCAALSACGGGGGGSNASAGSGTTPTAPVVNDDACLTLTPNPLNITLTQGSPASSSVNATANCNFPDLINVAIIDNKGVFSTNVSVTALSQYSYNALLRTATGLAAGTYDGTLEIRLCKDDPKVCSQPHKGSPWHLPYHVQVNLPLTWSIQAAPAIVATADTAAANLGAQTVIGLSGGTQVQWHASVANAPWLKLVNAGGATNASSLQVAVDAAEFAKLPNFADYAAVVNISTDTPNLPPTTTTITLKKVVAEISYAGPYTVLPGLTTTVHLHGRGLNSLNDPAGALQASGIIVSNVKRVSDGEISVQVSPGGAATGRFSIRNAMGLDTGSATVKAVAPAAYGYKAIAMDGYKGTLHYDAERQALLVVNRTQAQVLRYVYSGGVWTPSSVAIASADDAALSPDGQSLVVISSSGLISLLDPATLALQASYQDSAYSIGAYVASRLAVTNDGRAWHPVGYSSMAYFDLHTRQAGRATIADSTNYYYAGFFSVSGDGEHMILVPMTGGTPAPPVEYLSTVDGLLRNNPDANFTNYSTASQNSDGSRMVIDDARVRDGDFKTLGRFAVSDGSAYANDASYGSVLAPDGMRAYVMYLGPRTDPNMKPRIYVFDTSKAVSDVFPILGYFDVADSPTSCMAGDYCDPRTSNLASADGRTLFFAGNKNILVIPVPSSLQH